MTTTTADAKAETIFGITAVTTAGGILTFALFPLMLPGIVLLAILALPLLPLAVAGAVIYAIVALARGGWRLARRIAVVESSDGSAAPGVSLPLNDQNRGADVHEHAARRVAPGVEGCAR